MSLYTADSLSTWESSRQNEKHYLYKSTYAGINAAILQYSQTPTLSAQQSFSSPFIFTRPLVFQGEWHVQYAIGKKKCVWVPSSLFNVQGLDEILTPMVSSTEFENSAQHVVSNGCVFTRCSLWFWESSPWACHLWLSCTKAIVAFSSNESFKLRQKHIFQIAMSSTTPDVTIRDQQPDYYWPCKHLMNGKIKW